MRSGRKRNTVWLSHETNVHSKLRGSEAEHTHTHAFKQSTQNDAAHQSLHTTQTKIDLLPLNFLVLLCAVIALKKNMMVTWVCFPDFFCFLWEFKIVIWHYYLHLRTDCFWRTYFRTSWKTLHTNMKTLQGRLLEKGAKRLMIIMPTILRQASFYNSLCLSLSYCISMSTRCAPSCYHMISTQHRNIGGFTRQNIFINFSRCF